MPQPPRPRYTVWVRNPRNEDDPFSHDIVISWGDQLRGELEQPRHGITNTMGGQLATLWSWCSLVRQKLYDGSFKQFQTEDCVAVDQHDDDGLEAELDPTGEPPS